jgi:ABC-type glycerol-3-phosphate transport system permease component
MRSDGSTKSEFPFKEQTMTQRRSMAASTIALARVLIATFALQCHTAAGMTAGAVKG